MEQSSSFGCDSLLSIRYNRLGKRMYACRLPCCVKSSSVGNLLSAEYQIFFVRFRNQTLSFVFISIHSNSLMRLHDISSCFFCPKYVQGVLNFPDPLSSFRSCLFLIVRIQSFALTIFLKAFSLCMCSVHAILSICRQNQIIHLGGDSRTFATILEIRFYIAMTH